MKKLMWDISTKKPSCFHPIKAKLIFNPESGQSGESPQQLVSILSEMQNQHILPEVFIVHPQSRIRDVVHNAIKSGIRLIVVAGGDGTIDSVIGAMVGHKAILGIIPTGTRNNIAFNLGIPGDIEKAVTLLRQGRRMKIDLGRVHFGHSRHWFLEATALGLLSDLYPLADKFQHGHQLSQLGKALSTFISSTPSRLRMNLDGKKQLETSAHMMMITNMPFLGPHFQISPKVSYQDGRLDVFTFSDMTKLRMLSYAVLSHGGLVENASIKHYRARNLTIVSHPPMPVLADGMLLKQGLLSVHVHPRALRVMAGSERVGQPPMIVMVAPKLQPDE